MITRVANLIVVVAMLGLATTAQAKPDDLYPEEGVFSGIPGGEPYYLALRDALLGDAPCHKCQVVVVPSSGSEWAVYLVRDDANHFQMSFQAMKEQLWGEMLHKIQESTRGNLFSTGGPAATAALSQLSKAVQRRTAPLSDSTGTLLDKVWALMLARVRYPDPERNIGVDGTTYYVSHWDREAGYRCGKTWSPDTNSRTGELVAIAEELRNYALATNAERAGIEAVVVKKANTLLARLKSAPSSAP